MKDKALVHIFFSILIVPVLAIIPVVHWVEG